MSVIISQQPGAVYSGGDKPSWEVPFNIENTNSDIEARIGLTLGSPLTYDGLYRQTARVENVGYNFYKGSVTYGANDTQPNEGKITYSFEIGGQTQKLYHSISTTIYSPQGKTAPNHLGLIGVKINGDQLDVEGVDISSPGYSFTLKCRFPASYFTIAKRNQIYLATVAPVNDRSFYAFDAGEVIFRKATGGLTEGDTHGDIEFNFECSPNLTNLTVQGVNGDVTGIAKDGWDYSEVCTQIQDQTEGETKSLIPSVYGVYVHKISERSDLKALLGV